MKTTEALFKEYNRLAPIILDAHAGGELSEARLDEIASIHRQVRGVLISAIAQMEAALGE